MSEIELTEPQVRALAELMGLFFSDPKNQAAFEKWQAGFASAGPGTSVTSAGERTMQAPTTGGPATGGPVCEANDLRKQGKAKRQSTERKVAG